MSKKMSKILKEACTFLVQKIKKLELIDTVIIFAVIIGYFDFGIFQSVVLGLYIVYKILTNKSNFYNKVAFLITSEVLSFN